MEKRKIQRTGGSSFNITLPKSWVEKNNVKEQDTVLISSDQSGTLIIRAPTRVQKQEKATIYIDALSESELIREIIASYVVGSEEVYIRGKEIGKEKRIAIRKAIQALLGFEILEESSTHATIKNISDTERLSFKQNLERMFSLAESMFRDAVTSLLQQKKELAKDVIERDFEVDKIYFFVLRQSHSILHHKIMEDTEGVTLEKVYYYETIASQLERIADHAVKIAGITAAGISLNAKMASLFENVASKIYPLLKKTAAHTNTLDKKMAHETLNAALAIRKEMNVLHREIITHGPPETIIIVDSMERVDDYLINIAELIIDAAIENELLR